MAEWTTAYINDLPDSAFACIDGGGTKEDGKTVPRSLRHYPHHDASGAVDEAHLANARARVKQAGTTSCGYSHLFEVHKMASDREITERPPRDGVRAVFPGVEWRASDDEMGVMTGHFAVFNRWTEIHSTLEGHFMERIAPGAFARAIKNNLARVRVLFQHGQDPVVGDKPVGPIDILREEEIGPYYEVPLLDTDYNRGSVLPLLQGRLMNGERRGSLLGASFRFQSVKEDFERNTKASPYNPDALPERTIREVELFEFGPVTFPAYAEATAGVRSMTDEYSIELLLADPERVRALLGNTALPDAGPDASHSDEGTRPVLASPRLVRSDEDWDLVLERITSG